VFNNCKMPTLEESPPVRFITPDSWVTAITSALVAFGPAPSVSATSRTRCMFERWIRVARTPLTVRLSASAASPFWDSTARLVPDRFGVLLSAFLVPTGWRSLISGQTNAIGCSLTSRTRERANWARVIVLRLTLRAFVWRRR
jgi:hypothetical protein